MINNYENRNITTPENKVAFRYAGQLCPQCGGILYEWKEEARVRDERIFCKQCPYKGKRVLVTELSNGKQ